MPTKEELHNWRINPTTKKILQEMEERVELIKEEWAQNFFSFSNEKEAEKRGEIRGLRGIFEIIYRGMEADENE